MWCSSIYWLPIQGVFQPLWSIFLWILWIYGHPDWDKTLSYDDDDDINSFSILHSSSYMLCQYKHAAPDESSSGMMETFDKRWKKSWKSKRNVGDGQRSWSSSSWLLIVQFAKRDLILHTHTHTIPPTLHSKPPSPEIDSVFKPQSWSPFLTFAPLSRLLLHSFCSLRLPSFLCSFFLTGKPGGALTFNQIQCLLTFWRTICTPWQVKGLLTGKLQHLKTY